MSEKFLRIRVKEGCELPARPDNRHPGQFQYDSDWYPLGGTADKPKQLTYAWSIVPEGAALAGQAFFTQNGECLVETEPYEGPTEPHELAPAAPFTVGGRPFQTFDELQKFILSGDVEERERQIRARRAELAGMDKAALLNAAKAANLKATTGSDEASLRDALIDAQFGEGASLTAPGPVSTTVSGEPKAAGA